MQLNEFPKIPRLVRDITISEKIDGTNASILIKPQRVWLPPVFLVSSRTRWITPEDDHFGFAKWAHANREALVAELGEGHHFGEWWGMGIQRKYGMKEKRLSLFNTFRWKDAAFSVSELGCVPVLYQGVMNQRVVEESLDGLRALGSVASPGFMNPEGVVIYHHASKQMFKQTCVKDEERKGVAA